MIAHRPLRAFGQHLGLAASIALSIAAIGCGSTAPGTPHGSATDPKAERNDWGDDEEPEASDHDDGKNIADDRDVSDPSDRDDGKDIADDRDASHGDDGNDPSDDRDEPATASGRDGDDKPAGTDPAAKPMSDGSGDEMHESPSPNVPDVASACSAGSEGGRRVIGYVRADVDIWANSFPGSFALDGLTHINLAFAVPNYEAGKYKNLTFAGAGDTYSVQRIKSLVSAAHDKGTKVLASFMGGYASNTDALRAFLGTADDRVASDLVALVKDLDLDGVDIDLEGKTVDGSGGKYANFVELVDQKLDAEFGARCKLLTAAVARWNGDDFPSSALNRFDFISSMSYDAATQRGEEHSTLKLAQDQTAYWVSTRGIPAERVVLGVPFYGYCYGTGCPKETDSEHALSYGPIVRDHPEAKDTDVLQSDTYWITYNGPKTITEKSRYAAQHLGGVMVWTLGHDDAAHSLFSALLEGQ